MLSVSVNSRKPWSRRRRRAAGTAATLLAWLKLLALDGTLAKAELKTLRPASCTPPPG